MTTPLTDLEITNLATRVAYMTDPTQIEAATDGQWVFVSSESKASGYQATLVYNQTTNTYALLNAGTNDFTDVAGADRSILFRNIAEPQLNDAVGFADKISKDIANGVLNKDANLIIGGHSLGDWLSKALVSLGFGRTADGQPVNFGIDGPGLTPFSSEMQGYADQIGRTYDENLIFGGRYLVGKDSIISFGMSDLRYTNVQTDAILTSLEHKGWGYQAVAYIRSELESAGFTGVTTRHLTQSEAAALGVSSSAFDLGGVTGFFDANNKLVTYAQIGVNGNQADLNTIQFFGMNGFDRFGKITSGEMEQLTCSISQKSGNVITTLVDDNCNLSTQDSGKVIDNGDGSTRTQIDLGNDGVVDADTVTLDGKSYDLNNASQARALEGAANSGGFWDSVGGGLGNFWNGVTQSISDFFVNAGSQSVGPVYDFGNSSPYLEPIGAFYDSQSKSYDQALPIADKTGVLVDSQGRRVSLATLSGLDVNHDGVLSVSEAASLKMLTDLNENGHLESVELNAVTSAIRSIDWGRLTQGNAVMASANDPLPPTMVSRSQPGMVNLAQPTAVNLVQAVPASNYRTLRDTDNRYYVNANNWIDFAANQVKINNGTRNTLIGTDGNDSFDGSYYAAYSAYFPTPLTNFMGGGGDDTVGGTNGNDTIWGGTGNDTLMGYGGDDKLYGEEGNDQLLGQDGADYLDGGSGDDTLFGYVGNDILNGGDGNDVLMGFTPSNDAKQTLNAGESDNDYLYGGAGVDSLYGGLGDDYLDGGSENDFLSGGAGDDRLFGGSGDDELQGNEGNDQLVGGLGDDKLFGQVGNDILWGGDGNDILMGFTASNEPKQTLSAGETDDDILYGEGGDDQLNGGVGNDRLDGGIGKDILLGGLGDDQLFGGDGNDELQGNEGNDQLIGGAGDDVLAGQVGNDTLWGGDGNDILMGFTASNEAKQALAAGETDDDILYGEGGDDNLYGGLGNDRLDGGVGNDILLGGLGDDQLFGGDGNDELQGNEGNDQLIGGAGDDVLAGQVGNDTLWGGDGNDILMGFTASNETQQTLNPGETDDDTLYGGVGSDILIGGLGDDQLFGGDGRDELQGGQGTDMLYGDAGNDNLFGQAGDDTLYGGDGDDLLVGFTASNEAQQSLAVGETDNDHLYGGAGSDTLIGGVGDDYLDGGAGADTMVGGTGNDTYIVNSVNDTIYEAAGEGYDTVLSSTSYLLNANIEKLQLLEVGAINGTGNALDNLIVGNSSDNILDGVTGADIMIGGAGNDIYYVDNVGDVATELTNEGTDTVQSSISYSLTDNVENLVLLDFGKPESGLVDGNSVYVYGYPKRNELDYMQGDAVQNYQGTCALTSIANLITQTGSPTTESQVVNRAISNNWAVNDPNLPSWQLGGSNVSQQRALLDSYNIRNDVIAGYNETGIANLVRSGRGVILALNAGVLWGDAAYSGNGSVNHAVTLTGAVYSQTNGSLVGFYIADSGRGMVSDMTRFVDIATFRSAVNVPGAYAIYTIEPIKLWQENIDGTGNSLDNTLVGNRGDNTLMGLAGNDTLQGGDGNDTLLGGTGDDSLDGGSGDDTYRFNLGDGHDTLADSQGTDTLVFGSDINARDVLIARNGTSLTLTVNSQDRLRIDGMLGNGNNAIDRVQFADGTIWYARSDGSGFNAGLSGSVEIVGTPAQGQMLTLANTLSDPDGLGAMRYQWQTSADGSSWTNISGATAATYALTQQDVNQRLRVSVSYVDGRGNTESVTTLMTTQVANVNDAPTGAVTIRGTAAQGQTLTASNTLSDADGLGTISHQWQSSIDGATWNNISGATNATYTLGQSDVSRKLRAVASYTDGFGTVETVTSTATMAVVNINDAPTGLLSITGSILLGFTLSADNRLKDVDGLGVMQYQWQRSSDGTVWADISGATRMNYALTPAVAGQQLRIMARYTDGFGTAESVASAAVLVPTVNQIMGTDASETITGTPYNDRLYDLGGNDTVYGLEGDDVFKTSTALEQNRFEGGAGFDIVDYGDIGSTSAGGIWVDLGAGLAWRGRMTNASRTGFTDTLVSIEGATGSAFNDNLIGNAVANRLWGAAGNDALYGGAGDDLYLFGRGDGQDTVSDSATGTVARTSPVWISTGKSGYWGTQTTYTTEEINAGSDTVAFGTGITLFDLDFERSGSDIVIGLRESGASKAVSALTDRTTLKDQNNVNTQIETIAFADGSSYSLTNAFRIGTAQNDVLTGTGTDEWLYGGAGADTITGGGGNDVLTGGLNADTLNGGQGNDRYVFNRGDGTDVILDQYMATVPHSKQVWVSSGKSGYWQTQTYTTQEEQNGGNDTLAFGAGITLFDLDFERSGSDIVIGLRESGASKAVSALTDRTTLKNQNNVNTQIETIAFADGTSYSLTNAFRIGTAQNDTLNANSGSPTLLYGGAGNDTMTGGSGNDVLSGGLGNDTLSGGLGNDRYVFNRGDGQDIIVDRDTTIGNRDVLSLGAGVTADQLWFSHDGNNLTVRIIGTTDNMTIRDWYLGSTNQIEQITANGKSLSNTQVEALVQAMSALTPPAAGTTTLPSNYQSVLNPVIAANWQ